MPGRYSLKVTPYLRGPLEDLTDPRVSKILAQKSAQIGWTDGVVNNWLGYTIDVDPAPTIVMFPRDRSAKDFNREKFEPMVDATPVLGALIEIKSRSKDSTQDYKEFPGGFLKLVGSNSPGGVKSTPAKRLIVEEPDDCNLNIRGQGDSIKLLEERGKTFADKKVLAGGTPTIKGISSIEAEMELSDKCYWHVPCQHCSEGAPLDWLNVKYSSDSSRAHPIYSDKLPETARYVCPSCGGEWNDAEKNANVRRGEWVASAEFRGVRGYYMNELMSPFADSRMSKLVEKYLEAQHELEVNGDAGKMITFWNATLGLAWEYQGAVADVQTIKDRVEDYAAQTVPLPAILLTLGVDVQHNRIAFKVKAWAEGEESWLVWADEFYGNVLEADVWKELDRAVVFRTYRHASGAQLGISAISIDCSDGQTADAVYAWARRTNKKLGAERVMPIKGQTVDTAEIFRVPSRPLDITATHKAAKFGLRPYMVGVSRAKDLILGADEHAGRINLRDPDGNTGRGPGRMHWYRGVRADYFDQLTAEVKAPARNLPKGKKTWQKKAGKANEFLDCEVYALHAARALRIDTYTEARWNQLRREILQESLFAGELQQAAAAPDSEILEAEQHASGDGGEIPVAAPANSGSATPKPVPQPQRSAARRRVRSSGVEL